MASTKPDNLDLNDLQVSSIASGQKLSILEVVRLMLQHVTATDEFLSTNNKDMIFFQKLLDAATAHYNRDEQNGQKEFGGSYPLAVHYTFRNIKNQDGFDEEKDLIDIFENDAEKSISPLKAMLLYMFCDDYALPGSGDLGKLNEQLKKVFHKGTIQDAITEAKKPFVDAQQMVKCSRKRTVIDKGFQTARDNLNDDVDKKIKESIKAIEDKLISANTVTLPPNGFQMDAMLAGLSRHPMAHASESALKRPKLMHPSPYF